MERHHGATEQRGMNDAATTSSGRVRSLRFSNRFATLEPYDRADEFLETLGGVELDANGGVTGPMLTTPSEEAAADVDAGIAFFGQFIDHEITFDPTSEIDRRNDPAALRNFRTPALDLDSVYGAGPEVRPFLYDDDDPEGAKLKRGDIGSLDPTDESVPRAARFGASDLQRNDDGAALITDPRNDENLIISQLQLAFIKLHNRVVDWLRSGDGHGLLEAEEEPDYHEEAERVVRWHYQWLVLNEFLPKVCDNSVLDDIRAAGRSYFLQPDTRVSIPVEFAGAAYRYGHSQIRDRYTVNEDATDIKFFPGPDPEHLEQMMEMLLQADDMDAYERPTESDQDETEPNLNGFEPVPENLTVDWSYLFDHQPDAGPAASRNVQPGRPIDTALPPALFVLPFIEGDLESLAVRNLRRGKALGLPSGQRLAAAVGIDPLDNDELPMASGHSFGEYLTSVHRGADTEAPLWFYVLAEAEVQGNGHRLGALGSRIVGEVITGLVDADERTYRNEEPAWTPTLPRPVTDEDSHEELPYRFGDLLQFATGPAPDGLDIVAVDGDGSGKAPDTPASDPTNGEAVLIDHTGAGPAPIDGYTVDYDEQRVTIGGEDEETVTPLYPGERLIIYTGNGPSSPADVDARVYSVSREKAAIEDSGETVTLLSHTGEVSSYAEYSG